MKINDAKTNVKQWWSQRNSFQKGLIVGASAGVVVATGAVATGYVAGTIITKIATVTAATVSGALMGAAVYVTAEQAELNYKLRLLAAMQLEK